MKKLFAVAIALMMVLALSATAFAADSGSFTMSGDGSWWVQKSFAELTGENWEGHTTLTISSPEGGIVMAGYTSSEWTTTEDGVSSFTIDLADVHTETDIYIILRSPEGDFTIEWAFDADSAAAPAEEETPAAEEAPAVEETPAEEAPATNEAPAATAPKTGIALAVVPAIISLAAVAVTKRR